MGTTGALTAVSPGWQGIWTGGGAGAVSSRRREGATVRLRSLVVLAFGSALVFVGVATASASFPGGNGRIAFEATWNRTFTMRADGTHVARIGTYGRHPVWSPDGTQLAMFRIPSGDLAIYDVATDAWATVAKGGSLLTGFDSGSLAWSPDGTYVVVGAINNLGNTNLFTMATDGTGVVRLTPRKGWDFQPAWSNDGTRIAFVSFNDKGKRDLVIANADGSNRTVIPDGGARYQPFAPNWSPDDASIVFARWDSRSTTDIVTVDVGTGTLTPITATQNRWEQAPVYSPDGGVIAYVRGHKAFSNEDVFTMPAAGGAPTRLTDTPKRDESFVDWQPRPRPV
jgi:Tol biopolymer transport system component